MAPHKVTNVTDMNKCGNSSVGRARPCQGRGREFESRFPLQNIKAGWQSGYAAACKAVDAGSIPTPAFLAMCNARVAELVDARDLKSLGILSRAGSIPAPGKIIVYSLGNKYIR